MSLEQETSAKMLQDLHTALEHNRDALIDLSGRNALLKTSARSVINFSNIDAIALLNRLVVRGLSVEFDAIPMPTEEALREGRFLVDPSNPNSRVKRPRPLEWAKHIGLQLRHEFTTNATQTQSKILISEYQTLAASRIRSMVRARNEFFHLTGTNILYLAMGFLDWKEAETSTTSLYSPLLLIPVTIEDKSGRKGGLERFSLAYTGDELIENYSLKLKLASQLGIEFPLISGDPDKDQLGNIGSYFQKVERAIKKSHPSWKVDRRLALGVYRFRGQHMYLDLNNENWVSPSSKYGIFSNPNIQMFYGNPEGGDINQGDTAASLVSYNLDEEFPDIDGEIDAVLPADSSQHSAVIDAAHGKSFVIVGPPGTGKSQTIANIIINALKQEKKVLFVADKLAALDVVSNRLRSLGFGPLLLELHSDRAKTLHLLEELRDSRDFHESGRPSYKTRFDMEFQRLQQHQNKLRDYATTMRETWKDTQMTVHELLVAIPRFRREFGRSLSEFEPDIPAGDLNQETISHVLDDIRSFTEFHQIISQQASTPGEIATHPWFGLQRQIDGVKMQTSIGELLEDFQLKLDDLAVGVVRLSRNQLPENLNLEIDLKMLHEQHEMLSEFQNLSDAKFQVLVEIIENQIEPAEKISHEYAKGLQFQSHITEKVQEWLSENKDANPQREHLSSLKSLPKGTRLQELRNAAELALEIHHLGSDMAPVIERLENLLNLQTPTSPLTIDKVRLLVQFLPILIEYPSHDYRAATVVNNLAATEQMLNSLKVRLERYETKLDSLRLTDAQLEPFESQSHAESIIETFISAGFFQRFSRPWREARGVLTEVLGLKATNTAYVRSELKNIVEALKYRDEVDQTPNAAHTPSEIFMGHKTDVALVSVIIDWSYKARKLTSQGGIYREALFTQIMATEGEIVGSIRDLVVNHELLARLQAVLEKYRNLPRVAAEHFFTENTEFSSSEGSPWFTEASFLQEAVTEIASVGIPLEATLAQASDTFERIEAFTKQRNVFTSLAAGYSDAFGTFIRMATLEHNLFSEETHNAIELLIDNARTLAAWGMSLSHDKPARYPVVFTTRGQLVAFNDEIASLLEPVEKAMESILTQYDISFSNWFHDTWGIEMMISRNQEALNHKEWFIGWMDYINFQSRLANFGLSRVLKVFQEESLDYENLLGAVRAGILNKIAAEIYTTHKHLQGLSGSELSSIQKRFREADEEVRKLQAKQIAQSLKSTEYRTVHTGKQSPRVGEKTGWFLLSHILDQVRPRVTIKSLLARSWDTIMAMTPCLMMGPTTVAQFLEKDIELFDVVIMDEASQLEVSDAMGAIARGKQIIIVGDPKQLPPTSFFSKTIGTDDEDEGFSTDGQSILDVAQGVLPSRYLTWHYRSEHESLISFSNEQFYEEKLTIFPSTHSIHRGFGVHYHYVSDGLFQQNTNVAEAEDIVDLAQMLLEEEGHRNSIGIVAMNRKQADLIDQLWQERLESFPDLQAINTPEPIFIRNLENVQGDERDIIIISTTYGPDHHGGPIRQNFGPINSESGWRRLNVLFTRAKKRMYVVSSIQPQQLRVSETSGRGLRAFRDFLSYAASSGVVPDKGSPTGREPDSDFEIEVINALEAHGYICHPQYGVAGYRIDIAVENPDAPGDFLMAIECDGATYHSALSVRDRDKIRQQILESRGWHVERIWSTDWYREPVPIIHQIVATLEGLRKGAASKRLWARPSKEKFLEQLRNLKSDPIENNIFTDASPSRDVVAAPTTPTEEPVSNLNENSVAESAPTPQRTKEDLRKILLEFDRNHIRAQYPDTAESERLLSDKILDILVEHKPTGQHEFRALTSFELRAAVAPNEFDFLTDIFNLIQEFNDRP